jgi:photosystem II stability/assembly factor-like uncharacterized protein
MIRNLTIVLALLLAFLAAQASEWTPLAPPTNLDLISADFYDQDYGWMVGAGGRAFRTTDCGRNWSRQDIGVEQMLIKVDVLARDNFAFLTTDNEVIVHMEGNVRRTTPVPNAILYDIAYLSQNTLVVVGQIGRAGRGVIARSTDGGRTWSEIGHGAGNSTIMYTGLHFVTPLEGYMVGGRPRAAGGHTPIIGKTRDGGLTWQGLYGSSTSGEDLLPTDVTSFGVNRIVVVGTSTNQMEGHILRSTNAGESWTKHEDPVYARIRSIDTYNNRVGFAVTTWPQSQQGEMPEDRPMVLRTDDGGLHWMNDHSEFTANTLYGVACARGGCAIVVGSGGRVLRRTFDCDAPELIRTLPAQIRRPIGSIATINATATTSGVDYRWTKDGQPIDNAEPTLSLYRVRPTDAGEYEVTISNDCGSIVARTTLVVYEAGVLVAQKSALDFGYAEVNSSRDTVVQGLFRNEGSEDVRIERVRTFGADGAFSITTSHQGTVLRPGQSIDVGVRYHPTSIKAHVGIIDVETNSDVDPTVYLSGMSTSRDHMQGLSVHDPIRFAATDPHGSVDTLVRAVLTNTGTTAVTVRRADITGENAQHFGLQEPLTEPVRLDPGSALDLRLVFAPTYNGTFRAELDLMVDDRSIVIPMSGVSGLLADGEVVNFGSVAPGTTRDTVLTFHHYYDLDLTLREISGIGQPFEIVESFPPLPATVGGWHYVTVRVRFRPTAPGVVAQPIRLYWEDAGGNRFNAVRRVLRGGVDAPTSVEDDPTASRITVHPMPARDHMMVTMASERTIATIELMDLRGLRVATDAAISGREARLHVAGIVPGIYVLRVTDDLGDSVARRIIIE